MWIEGDRIIGKTIIDIFQIENSVSDVCTLCVVNFETRKQDLKDLIKDR